MNLIQCPNGHYYDADKYQQGCPHCAENAESIQATMPVDAVEPVAEPVPVATPVAEPVPVATTTNSQPADIQKTVGYFDENYGLAPVVGWLVCIDGTHVGKDFRLISGRNFIGRSTSNDVVLEGDASVSREAHVIVVYEPKSNTYLIQPGSSKELSYLNDNVVLESKVINANDIITVGATKLMFIPCCSDKFTWNK